LTLFLSVLCLIIVPPTAALALYNTRDFSSL
jgi:hypothetical protein